MPSLAMLFQSHLDPTVDGERLVGQMLTDFPDLDPSTLTVESPKKNDDPLTLTYGDQTIALAAFAAPVGDDVAQIAAYSRLWPGDVPAPVDYQAHTIVTVVRSRATTSYEDAIGDAVLLSKVIAAAVALTDTIVAVYFGNANHVVLPALFRDLAIETLPDPILPAWVALNVAPRPDGIMTGHTRGLDMLGLMDVEIVASRESAEDTFGRIINTAIYQLENGPIVGDGDTIGETDSADLVVHHAPSQVDADKTVLSLEFVGEEFPPLELPDVDDPAVDDPAAQTPKKRRWFGRRR